MGRALSFGASCVAIPLAVLVSCSLAENGVVAGDASTSTADGSQSVDQTAPDAGIEGPPPGDSPTPADRGGCDADTETDPSNCGACGHSCLGGACDAGRCQPVVVAESLNTPQGIGLDPTDVYVGAFGGAAVAVCPLEGCSDAAPVAFATGQNQPNSVSILGKAAYWSCSGNEVDATVNMCATGTAPCSPTTIHYGTYIARSVATSSGVYFTDQVVGSLYVCPLPDCAGGAQVLASGLNVPFGLAVNATDIYWASMGISTMDGVLDTCSLSHCSSSTRALVTGRPSPKDVAIDTEYVYWTESVADGSLMRCNLSGCGGTPTTLVAHLDTPEGVAVDDERVYVASSGAGTVIAYDKEHATVTTIAQNQTDAWSVAVNGTAIYWTNRATSGQLMMIAK